MKEIFDKKGEMVFRDYYNSLSDAAKVEVRDRIMDESGMSIATFYYKLKTNTWRPLEVNLINTIIENFE